MIKTIKVKKELNLHELIAYISVSGIKDANFVSNYENIVSADHSGQITTVGKFYNDTFTVEVEEEINTRHKFRQLTTIFRKIDDDKVRAGLLHNSSLYDALVGYGGSKVIKIYALVGTTLELIWEAE